MNNFELSVDILNKIIYEEIPFALASKNAFAKNEVSPESRSLIMGMVGCELRHHYILRAIARDKFAFEKEDEKNYLPLFVVLANELYYKKLDSDAIKQNMMKMTGLTPKDVANLIDELKGKEDFVPTRIQNGSLEYLSYRFSTPLWLVKMWDKQFGRGICFKFLKSNFRPYKLTVGVNTSLTSEEKLLETGKFEKTSVDNLLLYTAKDPLKNSDFARKHEVYLNKMPTKDIVNRLTVNPMSKTAFFLGYSSPVVVDYALTHGNEAGIDVIVSDFTDYTNLKREVGQFKINNINIFNEKANTIESCLSEKVDIFFLLPRNTNYELLKSAPDYFLRCKNGNIDALINEQRYSLEESYNMLNENGTLVYMVPTLNKKETFALIKDFLLIHRDMSLLEEKLYLPFDETDSLMYYAKFIKTKKK